MPYFRREGHPVVTIQAFLDFVGDHLPQEPFLELPILTGEELYETAMCQHPNPQFSSSALTLTTTLH